MKFNYQMKLVCIHFQIQCLCLAFAYVLFCRNRFRVNSKNFIQCSFVSECTSLKEIMHYVTLNYKYCNKYVCVCACVCFYTCVLCDL